MIERAYLLDVIKAIPAQTRTTPLGARVGRTSNDITVERLRIAIAHRERTKARVVTIVHRLTDELLQGGDVYSAAFVAGTELLELVEGRAA